MSYQAVMGGLVAVVSIISAGVLLLGARAKAALTARYSAPGQLVDVGGYKLHVHCQGDGSPAVVMDAGAGDYGLSWALVQPQVAEFARACVYDRAGLGWSDPGPEPRTNQAMVKELHALLTSAGIPGPYVMVGASLGGLNARLYAHTYPEEVAGLVLVDAVHEEQFAAESVQKTLRRMNSMMSILSRLMQVLIRSGIPAMNPALLPNPGLPAALAARLPARDRKAYQALRVASPRVIAASSAEMGAIMESHAQMRAQHITSLGDIPLVVIRHGKEQPMMGDPETARQMEQNHVRFQDELAAQSSNGRLLVAEQSGHAIQLEEPELVVQAIREVVMAARARMLAGGSGAGNQAFTHASTH